MINRFGIKCRSSVGEWTLALAAVAILGGVGFVAAAALMSNAGSDDDGSGRLAVTVPLGQPVTAVEGYTWPLHSDGVTPLSSTMIQQPVELRIKLPSERVIALAATAATMSTQAGVIVAVEPLPLERPLPFDDALRAVRQLLSTLAIDWRPIAATLEEWQERDPSASAVVAPHLTTALTLEEGVRLYVNFRPHRRSGSWFVALSFALLLERPLDAAATDSGARGPTR